MCVLILLVVIYVIVMLDICSTLMDSHVVVCSHVAYYTHHCLIQILMSVLLIMEDVIRTATTLLVHITVPVTLGSY